MSATISLIKGDGIGTDVGERAEYFVETGLDIEPQGEERLVVLTQFLWGQ